MRIIHTSDWHIGRSLYGRKRYREMEAFLAWLEEIIVSRKADALLIAGDVFDNTTPSNQAQELYYRFLQRLAGSPCRHAVIIAGNHDSPSFLDAPRTLLKLLNIQVIGQVAVPEDEVLLLNDGERPELIVCAVPYLHDRDVRAVGAVEDIQERQRALVHGISGHYAAVLSRAHELQSAFCVPIVLMGHLFVTGGMSIDAGDGVRELYVGAQVQIRLNELLPTGSPGVSYVALGHLHIPQCVAGGIARYSGSPIPMGFGEANQQKSVCLVDIEEGGETSIELIPVPIFQRLERVRGGWEDIERRLTEIRLSGPLRDSFGSESVWLEVVYEGEDGQGGTIGLQDRLARCLEECPWIELLCTRDEARIRQVLGGHGVRFNEVSLDELSPLDVFERRLEVIPEEQREALRVTYREALTALDGETEVDKQ